MTTNVGAQLQQARRARNLSFADVTKDTKIQPWVLEALEADRLHNMMSPVYAKGFLTTYAKFLRLDPEALVAQLRWPQPEPEPEALPPAPAPRAPIAIRLPLPLLRRLGTAAGLGAAVVGLLLVHPLQRLPKISRSPRQAPKLAKQQALIPKPASPVNTPALASVASVSEPVNPPPAPPALMLLPTQSLELAVAARQTTWIQVRADGKLLTQQKLPRGANERWTAKKQFELIIAKPSQVELTLNGQSISPFAIAHHGRMLITHHGVIELPEEE